MKPFTICYGLMTLALGSVVVYSMASADDVRNPFGDARVFASNATARCQPTIILPPTTDTAASVTSETAPVASDAPVDSDSTATTTPEFTATLTPGMSATEVRMLIGEPDGISPDGARWSYGSSVLIFNHDQLAGHVAFDPVQAALNKYNHMIANLESLSPATTGKTAKTGGPKILHSKTAPRKYSKYLYRPMLAGSSRNAYRYNQNHQEYSYYMNRYGPMDRFFTSKKFLPRGMTNSTDRNIAGSYLSNGNYLQGTNPNTQYRR